MGDFTRLEAWIERRLARANTPGLALVVTDRRETRYVGTFGLADLAAETPVSEHHAFEIGSIGKSFTAMTLLILQERGLVDLKAPVTDFLPWFEAGPHTAEITLHHLLTHSSGIIGGSDLAAEGRYEAWTLRDQAVLGAPGEHFLYSNLGYKILGYVIEEITGQAYGKVATREILAPLGMTESFTPITDRRRPRLAIGYEAALRDRPARAEHGRAPAAWIETGTADGSIAGPIGDMARYTRLLMNRGAGLISDESFALMIADLATRDTHEPESTYGYGLMTWDENGRHLIGHGGGMIGYYASLQIDPEADLGVFAMVNGTGAVHEIANVALNYLRAVLAGEEPAALPEITPAASIPEASEYAGVYEGDGETWDFTHENDRLYLERPYGRAAVESAGRGTFIILDPTLDRAALAFERNDDKAIVALTHGARWLAREGSEHPAVEPAPAQWRAYTGEYQNYNPWSQRFTILIRRGALWCDFGDGKALPMTELEPGCFQLGEAPSGDRLRFEAIAQGQALRVDLSGQPYFRTRDSSLPFTRPAE
ncbi:MAG: serine hydrolase [Thermomicrobiales bacterium]|nr:serine hydrolase [Thermomicrobiales bacterium]